jgi:hypothetical protein
MEQLLINVVTNLPNFAVAIVMLFWQRQIIEKLLESQSHLIDRLLQYVDNDKQAAERVIAQVASSADSMPHRLL